LAGEPAADEVDSNSVSSKPCSGELAHVSVDWDAWPVMGEADPLGLGRFAEGDGSHPGSLEPEGEAADSAEEVKNLHPDRCDSHEEWLGKEALLSLRVFDALAGNVEVRLVKLNTDELAAKVHARYASCAATHKRI
jgi:hypothetical protein